MNISKKEDWKRRKTILLEIALVLLVVVLALPLLFIAIGGTNSITGSVVSIGLPEKGGVINDTIVIPENGTELFVGLPLEVNEGLQKKKR